eukprot:scaffold2923_cov121-Cylindrotheca_fusiformis.AAC.19
MSKTSNHHQQQEQPIVVTNRKWILERRPQGVFQPKDDVKVVSEELEFTCLDDEVIVETEMLSVDAFLRTMMDEDAYHGSINLGDTIPALGYGTVVHAGSKTKYKVGSSVQGLLGAQTFSKVKAEFVIKMINIPFLPKRLWLGILSLTTGLTAYTGIFYVCDKPKKWETVVVSAAAGAVGSVAAQLAKSTGARGGPKKQEFLMNELKLDGSIDYKDPEKSVSKQLEELCPNGVDFIYDNVGGTVLDTLLKKINPKGRIVICGAVSQYSGNLNHAGKVQGPSNYLVLAERGATMKGFNVMQYAYKLPFAIVGMLWKYLRGRVFLKEHVGQGIDSFPSTLYELFNGGSIGKSIVDVKQTNK